MGFEFGGGLDWAWIFACNVKAFMELVRVRVHALYSEWKMQPTGGQAVGVYFGKLPCAVGVNFWCGL